jgi:hypothetical protein
MRAMSADTAMPHASVLDDGVALMSVMTRLSIMRITLPLLVRLPHTLGAASILCFILATRPAKFCACVSWGLKHGAAFTAIHGDHAITAQ